MVETIVAAAEQMEKVAENPQAAEQVNAQGLEEVVADKGYHSNQAMVDLREVGLRSYVSSPLVALAQIGSGSIGPGEHEVISLVLELRAERLLLDEQPARRLATRVYNGPERIYDWYRENL